MTPEPPVPRNHRLTQTTEDSVARLQRRNRAIARRRRDDIGFLLLDAAVLVFIGFLIRYDLSTGDHRYRLRALLIVLGMAALTVARFRRYVLDEDGHPLEACDAERLRRHHRRAITWDRRLLFGLDRGEPRGPELARAIHGDAILRCELDPATGNTIAYLRNGDTITVPDFATHDKPLTHH